MTTGAGLDALPATPAVAALRQAVQALPPADRPAYRSAGTLDHAPGHAFARGPGLYLLLFDTPAGPRAYSGMALDLRTRLQQHRRCAQALGVSVARHQVLVAPVAPGADAAARLRRIEHALHRSLLGRHRAVMTNQRHEIELPPRALDTPPFTPEENSMHTMTCQCGGCRAASAFELLEFAQAPDSETDSERDTEVWNEAGFGGDAEAPVFNEAMEYELAMELLSVNSEEELDLFLGRLVKGAWKGLRKVGRGLIRPLGKVLKGVAKAALPFVGGALGSLIPIPGVGTALGTALGGAVSKALESEHADGHEQEVDMARRFVRLAGVAARRAARVAPNGDGLDGRSGLDLASRVVMEAAQRITSPRDAVRHGPAAGRWQRRGSQVVVMGL